MRVVEVLRLIEVVREIVSSPCSSSPSAFSPGFSDASYTSCPITNSLKFGNFPFSLYHFFEFATPSDLVDLVEYQCDQDLNDDQLEPEEVDPVVANCVEALQDDVFADCTEISRI